MRFVALFGLLLAAFAATGCSQHGRTTLPSFKSRPMLGELGERALRESADALRYGYLDHAEVALRAGRQAYLNSDPETALFHLDTAGALLDEAGRRATAYADYERRYLIARSTLRYLRSLIVDINRALDTRISLKKRVMRQPYRKPGYYF